MSSTPIPAASPLRTVRAWHPAARAGLGSRDPACRARPEPRGAMPSRYAGVKLRGSGLTTSNTCSILVARRCAMPMSTAQPPVPDSALDLLARSDAELVAATLASASDETLLHAHLAALRAGAALVQVRGRTGGRPAPRTVWDMVAVLAPELAAWAAFFADNAGTRSAVEAGRGDLVDARRAERALAAAEDFQTAVRAVIGAGVQPQGQLALRAS